MHFGEMGVDWRVTMLKRVRGGDAYCHAYDLITAIAVELTNEIEEEVGDRGPLGL